MFFKEVGQYKSSYSADQGIFRLKQERWIMFAQLVAAIVIIPIFLNDYWANAILIPFLVYSLAALGLNILVGYCGQISLGTGGFMAVGAYASYKLMTGFPEMDIITCVLISGAITAAVGVAFGLPSLRIKGFYLAVATLAAQFFLVWLFNKFGWFYNYSASGQITAPERSLFGFIVSGPSASVHAKYFVCLFFVIVFTLVAKNLVRSRIGRTWMAIRDMDIAAELIGVRPLISKLSAFAVSSFLVGISGALFFAIYLGAAESGDAFGITVSFNVLFMIILGGLGSILGSFLGAAFLVLLPIGLKNLLVSGFGMEVAKAEHINILVIGLLILVVLIKEPHGMARLWHITKEKLKTWPFPY